MFNIKLLIISNLVVFLLTLSNARNIAYAENSQFYVGGSFGGGSGDGFDDVSATTFYSGGYLGDKLALEMALVDMGGFSHGKGMDSISTDLSVLVFNHVDETWETYFKVGLHIWNLDGKKTTEGEERSSYLIGLGVNKSLGQALGARIEWISYYNSEDDVEDVGILNLGLYTTY